MIDNDNLISIDLIIKDKLNNTENLVKGCVDTASNMSAISSDLAQFLNLDIKPSNVRCQAVNKTVFKPEGQTEITLRILDFDFHLNVLVIPDFEDEVLLGADFLELAEARIDYKNHSFIIQKQDLDYSNRKKVKNIVFRNCESEIIPKNSYKFIEIYSDKKVEQITEVESYNKLAEKHGIYVANSLFVPNESNKQIILIANYSEKDFNLINDKKNRH